MAEPSIHTRKDVNVKYKGGGFFNSLFSALGLSAGCCAGIAIVAAVVIILLLVLLNQ